MAGMTLRRLLKVVVAVLAGACTALPAQAVFGRCCPGCQQQGPILSAEIAQASMVLYGTFTNATPGVDEGQGSSDFQIEAVIKKHDILGDKKVITLPRYVPNEDPKIKFLVFCDVFKGKVDPYIGTPVQADCDMVKYIKGALEVKDKDVGSQLRYYFDFLENKESVISTDAFKAFGNADYKDFKEIAHKLPADRLVKWLTDPETSPLRYGAYAQMLGHCGTAKDADLLRKLLDDPKRRGPTGLDYMMVGYTLLKPKDGMAYMRGVLQDSTKEFTIRYAALQAIRFFWDFRQDVVDKNELVKGACDLLDQSDVADLAIEDLRKWGRWEICDRVLALKEKKSHDVSVIRRAILRYALSCPESKAAEYVQECRKRDAEMVKDAEELLKLDAPPVKAAAPDVKIAAPVRVPPSAPVSVPPGKNGKS